MKANYSYLSDGTKASVLNASGAGYDYNGTFTYSRASGGARTLESVAFGARRYDRTAWTSIDPLAEKYYSISPYAYCYGNPVNFVDPEGMFSIDTGLIEEGDNLTEITHMINAAFNIDNINNIQTGSYIILPGRNVSLLFDLKHLQVMDNTYGVALEEFTWERTSGRLGYQSPEYQSLKKIGPIPEGCYSVNPNDTQYYSDLSNFQRINSRFALGEWPGGKSSWGNSRTWIFPNNGTNTYGRSGFSIHGGSTPGSAGCIDLTSNNDSFNSWLQKYGKPIDLMVKY